MDGLVVRSELKDAVRQVWKELESERGTLTMTVEDVSRECNVHPQTVRNWAKSGLKSVQQKPFIFRRETVVKWLEMLEQDNSN